MLSNRVWIYVSEKTFDETIISGLKNELTHFIAGWNAHGTALSASFEIRHKHFIIIKADEEKFAASGCSIDKQVQFIKEIEKKYNLSLLNRLLVAYKAGDKITVVHSSKIPKLLSEGQINENTFIYNVAVSTSEDLNHNFEIPLHKSWLAKYVQAIK
jgi:hypothetical protein